MPEADTASTYALLTMSLALVGVVEIVPVVVVTEVNVPAAGVDPPMMELLIVEPEIVAAIVPPVIETELEFCVDIVPRPVMSVLGMVTLAVIAVVPVPFT